MSSSLLFGCIVFNGGLLAIRSIARSHIKSLVHSNAAGHNSGQHNQLVSIVYKQLYSPTLLSLIVCPYGAFEYFHLIIRV